MSAGAPIVICAGAVRTFGEGPGEIVALQATDCRVDPGDRVALVGSSGSGKSTLLHLMAGLDEPSLGEVTWPAIDGALRPGPVAIVFQGPSLLPALSVAENAALPLILGGVPLADANRRAAVALERLGLADIASKLPEEISGGQAQRVAVARALAGEPKLILADEPTGQLDSQMSKAVVDAILDAAEHSGAALVLATHDPEIAARLDMQWQLESGRLAVSGPTPERAPA